MLGRSISDFGLTLILGASVPSKFSSLAGAEPGFDVSDTLPLLLLKRLPIFPTGTSGRGSKIPLVHHNAFKAFAVVSGYFFTENAVRS